MEQEKTEKQFYEAPRPKTAEAPAAPDAFSRWADRAVRRVLLPKERRRVREELENHYQDRLDDYLRRGMSEQEARSRALDSLGDPEETAVLLGRVHKPWLILLVWAARVLFMLAALLMVLALLGRLFSLRSLQRVDVQALADRPRWGLAEGETRTVIARRKAVCADSVRFGPFTVACEGGSVHRDCCVIFDEYGNCQTGLDTECAVVLSYSAAPWHRMRSDVVDRVVRIVDSRGNEYRNVVDFSAREETDKVFFQYTGRVRFSTGASIFYFDELYDDVEWLDFYLEQSTEGKRLRVYLGPWQYARETLPPMDDKAVTSMAREHAAALCDWRIYDAKALRTGSQLPDSSGRLTAPWACQTRYRLNQERLDWLAQTNEAPQETPVTACELVECVLVFGDYSDSFPFDEERLAESLELQVPGQPAERFELRITRTPVWYADACVLRLEWPAVPGADRYEIRFTDPATGEAARVTLVLGEEGKLS